MNESCLNLVYYNRALDMPKIGGGGGGGGGNTSFLITPNKTQNSMT